MKVAVITLDDKFLYGNFGSAMQSYALQVVLREMGHEPIVVRWAPMFRSFRKLKLSFLYKLFSIVCPHLWDWAVSLYAALRATPAKRKHLAKGRRFFHRHVKATLTAFPPEMIPNCLPKADAYICGSDQVWHDSTVVNLHYDFLFLAGAPRGRCISYAASAPWARLDEKWVSVASRYLPNFCAVSVREEQGVPFCKAAGAENAFVAADPVLLLPQKHYEPLAAGAPIVKGDYLLCYVLNCTFPIEAQQKLQHFCQEQGMQLMILSGQGAKFSYGTAIGDNVGPEEFLNLIKNAKAVVTNSFHGSMFSLIFGKPLLVCLQDGNTAAENVRFTSTLPRLGQAHRMCTAEQLDTSLLLEAPVLNIEQWREESLNFLRCALGSLSPR